MDHLILINQIRQLEDQIEQLQSSERPEDKKRRAALRDVLAWRFLQLAAQRKRQAENRK